MHKEQEQKNKKRDTPKKVTHTHKHIHKHKRVSPLYKKYRVFGDHVKKNYPQIYTYRLVFAIAVALLCILLIVTSFSLYAKSLEREQEREREAIEKIILPNWERKTQTDQVLKLAVIAEMRMEIEDNYTFASDIEDRYYAVEKFIKPLAFFRSQMEKFAPEYIINMGSSIIGEDQDAEMGVDALAFMQAQLEKIGAPTLWVIGNRDMRVMTRTDYQEVTDAPSAPYTVDIGDYRLIVLDTNYDDQGIPFDANTKEYDRGFIDLAQIDWLEEELDTQKHVFVFMHHGAFEGSVPVAGKDDDKEKSIKNATQMRALFEKYNVAAVFTAHLKAYAYEKTGAGVEYFTAEDLRDYGSHPGAFYEMTITGGEPSVKMYYIDRDDEELDSQDYIPDAHKVINEEGDSRDDQ